MLQHCNVWAVNASGNLKENYFHWILNHRNLSITMNFSHATKMSFDAFKLALRYLPHNITAGKGS